MKQELGKSYRLALIGDQVALVHTQTGRAVFNLSEQSVWIDLGVDGAATCTVKFACGEPEK